MRRVRISLSSKGVDNNTSSQIIHPTSKIEEKIIISEEKETKSILQESLFI